MGRCLDEAVSSVTAQTYPAIEIVITDDGATDGETLASLRRQEEAGITVLRQANAGPAAARNAALRVARGEFFMPLDDDLIEPPYIEEAVRAMAEDPELGIVYCRAEMFGSVSGEWRLPHFNYPYHLLWNAIFACALFRREDWQTVGGYNEDLKGREDHDFSLRILGLGRTVHRLEGVYFRYRRGRPHSVNDAIHARSARDRMISTYATMFRTNRRVYLDHAEDFFTGIFAVVDERNELYQRYRHLEKLRRSRLGSAGLALLKSFYRHPRLSRRSSAEAGRGQ